MVAEDNPSSRWVKDKPIDHADHCLDCLAMLAAEVYTGAAIQIGWDRYS